MAAEDVRLMEWMPEQTDYVLMAWYERYDQILRRVRNVARRIEKRVASVLREGPPGPTRRNAAAQPPRRPPPDSRGAP